MAQPGGKPLAYAEYLTIEATSLERHELAGGELFAMSGGSPRHARIQARVLLKLGVALDGRPCQPYGPDLRLHFAELDESAYADTVVICGPVLTTETDPHGATNPTVVCEVLSPTTEGYDRGRKFEKYRRLTSLKEYVLVSQDHPLVEVFRRDDDGSWRLRTYGPGEHAELASVQVRLDVTALYAGVFEDEAGAIT